MFSKTQFPQNNNIQKEIHKMTPMHGSQIKAEKG